MTLNTSPETLSHNSSSTEERLSKLTGFNNPSALPADSSESDTTSPAPSSLLSDEDLDDQITRHSFASSPLSKLVFVAGAVFFVVFVASLFLSQFQSPGESVSAQKAGETREDQPSPLLSPENKDKEKGELLSELALREQKERLKDLEDSKNEGKQPETIRQEAKPVTRSVAVRPTPVRQVIRQPTPVSRPLPVRYPQSDRPLAVVRPTRIASTPTPSVDPAQVWLQLSQLGSFGSGQVSISPTGNPERLTPRYEPKTALTNVVANKSQPIETPVAESNSPTVSGDRAVPFGQTVAAVLETTIAWEGHRGSRTARTIDERYIVTLNESLKDKLGNLEIPAGSQLVIRIEGDNNALITLAAESIIVNGVETKLPQGALRIRGAKGQPLIAEMTNLGGNDGRDNTQALADVLSIAGDFADIPGSRSLSSLYRTLSGGNARRSGSGIATTVFFLRQGTPLEVFVNQTFRFDVPESPLELDLSVLDLSDSFIAIEFADSVEED